MNTTARQPRTGRTGAISRRSLASAALLAPFLLAGCSLSLGDDDGSASGNAAPADGGSSSADGSDSSDAGASDQAGGNTSSAEQESDSPTDGSGEGDKVGSSVDLPPALASADVTIPGEGDRTFTMTVAIHSLTRNGESLEAVYSFTPEDGAELGSSASVFTVNDTTQWQPYVVDTKNMNKHVLTDALSDNSADIMLYPGQPSTYHGTFGAPPEDVTEMDAWLWDGAPLAKAVKIQ